MFFRQFVRWFLGLKASNRIYMQCLKTKLLLSATASVKQMCLKSKHMLVIIKFQKSEYLQHDIAVHLSWQSLVIT